MDEPPSDGGIYGVYQETPITALSRHTELNVMWFEIKTRTIRIALLSGVVACSSLLFTDGATGQDVVLSQLYGKGVHAYFDGDFEAAHGFLTRAMEGRSRDPRVYYFRAMAYHGLGRPEEAIEDMNIGARLEVADVNQFYPVSRSLERVQGRERVTLERHRREARLEQYENARDRQQRRFGSGEDRPAADGAAPRELSADDAADAAPVEEPATDGQPADESDEGFKADGDPFGDDPAADGGDAATGDSDPFGNDASDDADGDENVFGDDAGEEELDAEDEDEAEEDEEEEGIAS